MLHLQFCQTGKCKMQHDADFVRKCVKEENGQSQFLMIYWALFITVAPSIRSCARTEKRRDNCRSARKKWASPLSRFAKYFFCLSDPKKVNKSSSCSHIFSEKDFLSARPFQFALMSLRLAPSLGMEIFVSHHSVICALQSPTGKIFDVLFDLSLLNFDIELLVGV